MDNSSATNALLQRWRGGDGQALAELFARKRERLRRMVRLRLDGRLQGRVHSADVLDAVYVDALRHAREYLDHPSVSFFLWLRSLAGQRLQALHRQHLGPLLEDADPPLLLHRGAMPAASSPALAAQLLGRMAPAAHAAGRAEMQLRLQQALNAMDPLEREVLVLRHFEELSNGETAQILGIDAPAASNNYLRALKHLKETLAGMPGFFNRG
jgi:RNA polymerase sigma-70 factor (ECF subfamily)